MSVRRSPPKGASGSGLDSDLRTNMAEDTGYKGSQRKRKQPESEVKEELSCFRREITKLFQEFQKTQAENASEIRQDIKEIKDEIQHIKTSTASIVLEQNNIKKELEQIKAKNQSLEEKVNSLEIELSAHNLENPQNTQPPSNSPFLSHLDLISEIEERSSRETNIILAGIPEINNQNSVVRREHDTNEVTKILKMIMADFTAPTKIFRLGKYELGKTRYLKVCLDSRDNVKYILRNRQKCNNNTIRIFGDQTPMQIKYYKELSSELQRRREAGDKYLQIKYIKGIPKIVTKTDTKNSDK